MDHLINLDNKNILTDDELIEILTLSYTLGYMKAWEKLQPESKIYNEEFMNNEN